MSFGLLAAALLLLNCDSKEDDRVMLQTEDSKVGQPREGYEAIGDESPLTPPNRYLRTHFKLPAVDEKDDIEVDVHVEEVTAGLRLSVIVDDAEAGRYPVVLHESGDCTAKKALGPVVDLMAPKTADADGAKGSDLDRALGYVEVKPDGDGRARWLTGWGTLRENDDKSVLHRPLVLYRPSEDKLGDIAACALITLD